jgi:hypothetical protein
MPFSPVTSSFNILSLCYAHSAVQCHRRVSVAAVTLPDTGGWALVGAVLCCFVPR